MKVWARFAGAGRLLVMVVAVVMGRLLVVVSLLVVEVLVYIVPVEACSIYRMMRALTGWDEGVPVVRGLPRGLSLDPRTVL